MFENLELVPAANVDADTVTDIDEFTFDIVKGRENMKHDEKLNTTKGNILITFRGAVNWENWGKFRGTEHVFGGILYG